jgi:predicted Zn-dependent protease
MPEKFATMLKAVGVLESDLAKISDDAVALGIYRKILLYGQKDNASRQSALKVLDDLSSLDKQWNVDDLLKVLSEVTKPYEQENVRFVGVTSRDIYGKDTSFLFASGYLNRFMVMSYSRFTAASTHELPNRGRLLKRATNQALSSCGKVFGIDTCTDPTCPRAYPNSVAEHDAKGDELCDICKAAFNKAFGRKEMPTSATTSPGKD